MESVVSGPIWLTEISGVERRGHCGCPNLSPNRANTDERYLFTLPKRFHRIQRIYHYQWQAVTWAPWDSGLLGPQLLTALGLGLLFAPLLLVSLTKVADSDTGVASSLVNVGQQVGGAVGLAVLGTVAWSAVANSLRSQAAAAAAAAKHATVHLSAAQQAAVQKAAGNHALAHGFSQGYLVSAGIMLLALIITLVAIRVKRSDLSGINPMAAPTG